MDELPELPLEQILSHLNLEDILKLKALSRGWYHRIDSFRVKTLCFSVKQSGFIRGKSRWVSGIFAKNFIHSTRISSFFDTFGQTILFNLKHLRLCDLQLNRTAFTNTLNSFLQLEELDIIRFDLSLPDSNMKMEVKLPMLHSIHLEQVKKMKRLVLNAPRLKKVKLWKCQNELKLVHEQSVERLFLDFRRFSALKNLRKLKNLRNLQYLQYNWEFPIESTLLSSLEKLKEVHLFYSQQVKSLFEQKQRYGRAELKIYLHGLLLSGPEDPAIPLLYCFNGRSLSYLAENPSALSDEIPFYDSPYYHDIEPIGRGLEMNILKKFTNLKRINVGHSIQDPQRFLGLLKNLDNIEELHIFAVQKKYLFDRLPEYSAVQCLAIYGTLSDFRFLLRLKNLIVLNLNGSIDSVRTIRTVLNKLPFLSEFYFWYNKKLVKVLISHLKGFMATIYIGNLTNVADLNGSMQFIEEIVQKKGTEPLE